MSLHNMLSRALSHTLRSKNHLTFVRFSSHGETAADFPALERERIGTREVVGYGTNGRLNYHDIHDFPFPAIRFKEITPDIQILKDKEMGDWKKMTLEEKKTLYRASFCQTFAEVDAPTGEWKRIMFLIFLAAGVTCFVCVLQKIFLYKPLPSTMGAEEQRKQLKYMIDCGANPVTGVASKWDYDNNKWK